MAPKSGREGREVRSEEMEEEGLPLNLRRLKKYGDIVLRVLLGNKLKEPNVVSTAEIHKHPLF